MPFNILEKLKRIPPSFLMGTYFAFMALTAVVLAKYRLPEQVFVVFVPLIVIVGVLFSRWLYLVILAVWTALILWIVSRDVLIGDSVRTIIASVLTITVMTESLRVAVRRRRETEEALRESERRYRRLIEDSPDGIALFNDDKMVFANPAAVQMIGASRIEELAGKPILDFVHPEDRERTLDHMRSVVAERKNRRVCEIRLLKQSGEWVDVEFAGMPFESGEHRGTHIVFHDITERKRAQEDRARLEAQVRYAQKLESLGILAGGIAHDFNNLLVGILGNASLSLTELPETSPYREPMRQIEVSARRAADLANEMLAYSGKGQFVVRPLDIGALLMDMKRLPKAVVSKKTEVRYEVADDVPAVEGDENQLRQVFVNLILNAGEAIGDAEGIITIRVDEARPTRADLSTTFLDDDLPEGTYVRVEISDTGCGMDEDNLARVFEPFFTTKAPGRGLGLAAVLGIVRGHRGAIRVQSKQGEGTAFTLLLPASKATPETNKVVAPPVMASESSRIRSGTILVADDEEVVRNLAKAVLVRAGFQVLTASDGQEAVDLFCSHSDGIDLVLLDMTMPHMSGGEAFSRIRQIRPDAAILFSSGYCEEDVVPVPQGCGDAAFIQKPYLATELLNKVQEVLQA